MIPYFSIFGVLGFWEGLIRLSGYDMSIFPPPSIIALKVLQLLKPSGSKIPILVLNLLISLARLAAAVVLASVVGVCLGVAAGMNRYAYRTVYPLVNALIPIPAYAWIPFLLLWLGRGDITIVFVTALSACLPLVYNTMSGVRAVDRRQVWALKTFGASPLKAIRYVVIPSALSSIILGLRLSFAQAWRTLCGAEFIAAPEAGLGFLIYSARQFMAVDTMFAGLLTVALFGYLYIYWLVGVIENRTVVRWGIIARK